VTIRIVDAETGLAVPQGQPGLIEVFGYLTPGYTGSSAAYNASVFTNDGWFRTGDIAALDTEGNLQFLGRSGEMIKRSGINVSPAEVEEALMLHPAVSQAGVVGVADAEKGEIIVAFVVARPGMDPTPQELAKHCRSVSSAYKVPDRIEIRQGLPVTVTGKLMRRSLKDEATALPPMAG
jgi:fatty-acyl-CoA synthase